MRHTDKLLVYDNQQIYQYYFERLVNIALSQFSYEEIPDTCDRWYFEKALLFDGQASFYKPDDDPETILSTGFVARRFNLYERPTEISGYGYIAANIQTHDFETLYDNMSRTPLIVYIRQYAYLLWEIHQTFRANLNMQRTPYIITATRNTMASMKNFFNQIFGFKEVIYVKNTEDIREAVHTLDLKVPFTGKELLECLRDTWDQALAMLGVTGEMKKHERMNNAEVMVNGQEDGLSLNARYLNRVEFVDRCNKRWGLNMKVKCNQFDTTFMPFPEYNYDDDESDGDE